MSSPDETACSLLQASCSPRLNGWQGAGLLRGARDGCCCQRHWREGSNGAHYCGNGGCRGTLASSRPSRGALPLQPSRELAQWPEAHLDRGTTTLRRPPDAPCPPPRCCLSVSRCASAVAPWRHVRPTDARAPRHVPGGTALARYLLAAALRSLSASMCRCLRIQSLLQEGSLRSSLTLVLLSAAPRRQLPDAAPGRSPVALASTGSRLSKRSYVCPPHRYTTTLLARARRETPFSTLKSGKRPHPRRCGVLLVSWRCQPTLPSS